MIEIELGRGRRLRVDAQVDTAALARIIGVLVACDGAYRYAARLLWINHDKPSSDARRHAPKLYE